jgi:hypothetical protein
MSAAVTATWFPSRCEPGYRMALSPWSDLRNCTVTLMGGSGAQGRPTIFEMD